MSKVLTESEKAERRQRMEARKAARQAAQAARATQEREDHRLIAEATRAVLRDNTASPAQRLTAIAILDEAEHYYLVTHAMRNAGQELRAFAEALKAATAEDSTT